jgi:hypothetical protein
MFERQLNRDLDIIGVGKHRKRRNNQTREDSQGHWCAWNPLLFAAIVSFTPFVAESLFQQVKKTSIKA